MERLKPIDHTEAYIHLTLQSFEGQIRIIHSLGYHSDRAQHIENLRRMVVALLKIVEADKEERLNGVERLANATINEFAVIHDTLTILAETSNDPSIRKSLSQIDDAQNKVAHNVGKKEVEINNILIERYNAIQEKVKLTLAQVEALKR